MNGRVVPRAIEEARSELLKPLGIGFIGSGFNARFHTQAFTGVRDAEVRGVFSPNAKHAGEAAALAKKLDVGNAKPYKSIAQMVADPNIDAIWLTGPNFARMENVQEIVDTLNVAKARSRVLPARSRSRGTWPKHARCLR